MTRKRLFGGSILGPVPLAAPPANVTFWSRTPYKRTIARLITADGMAHFFFRLKSFVRSDIFMNKLKDSNERRLCGRPNAEIQFIPLTLIRSARIGIEP
jgi:hypothetical protein